jgi:hypothetical protein
MEQYELEIIKFFSKFSGIPFPVISQLKLIKYYLDKYDAKAKYEHFLYEVDLAGGIEKYIDDVYTMIDKIRNDIRITDEYKNFTSMNIDGKNTNKQRNFDIYKEANIGKTYISIDIRQANFNVFKGMGIIDSSNEIWEDFISQYTEDDFLVSSKHLRQVVFGELNPKRQRIMQRKIIDDIVSILEPRFVVTTVLDDEVILDVDHQEYLTCRNMLVESGYNLNNELKTSYFKIGKNGLPFAFMFKEIEYEGTQYRGIKKSHGVNKRYSQIASSICNNRQVTDIDLYFEENNIIHKTVL